MMSAARQFSLEFLDEPVGHHALVHANPHGTVIVWERQATGNVWHKIEPEQTPGEIRAFLRGLSGKEDTFFTVNEFSGWRITRLLKSLRACYVDIDLKREATRIDLDIALELLRENAMPTPNLAVFSGRGLHLYWIMTHTSPKALPVWQATENALVSLLRDYGADPKAKDCARVLRLSGTVNSKTGETVRGLVLDGKPWRFHQLADEVLGHRPTKKPEVRSLVAVKARRGDEVHPKATNFRRWHLVLADLHRIGQHHGQIPEGHRNEFLFLGGVALSWFASPETIEDEVIDLAKLYCPEIQETEAMRAASQSIARAKRAAGGEVDMWQGEVKDPRYFFKRMTLWERMEDLANPIKHRLRAIIPDEISSERKQAVWSGRWSDHNTGEGYRQGNAEKVTQARSWRAEGETLQAIANRLGVSVSTVHGWLK